MIAGVDQGGDGEPATGGLSRESDVRRGDAGLQEGFIGGKSVVNILMRVLLPAPFEPMRPKISPGKTLSDTLSTATRSPKWRLKAEVLIAGSVSEEGVRVAPGGTAPVSASGADREDGLAVVHADFRIGLRLTVMLQ